MALKGIEHYQGSHYYHHKGPPFDIKHQLMLSDLLIVKIGLNSAIRFSFIFYVISAYIYQQQKKKTWSKWEKIKKIICVFPMLSYLTHLFAKKC